MKTQTIFEKFTLILMGNFELKKRGNKVESKTKERKLATNFFNPECIYISDYYNKNYQNDEEIYASNSTVAEGVNQGNQHIYLNGNNYTSALRNNPQMSQTNIAAMPTWNRHHLNKNELFVSILQNLIIWFNFNKNN